MDTHSEDLLYGTLVSSDDMFGNAGPVFNDDSVGTHDLGQGSGEEHISFRKEEDMTRKGMIGDRTGSDGNPTEVFDEFGNLVIRETEENDDSVPII